MADVEELRGFLLSIKNLFDYSMQAYRNKDSVIAEHSRELASAIGKKRFKPREKTIARVWQRSDDTSFLFSICLDHAGEILLGAKWSDLRHTLSEFVDSKTFGEAKQNDLLSVLDEDERVKEATVSLCKDEKKSVDETVDEVVEKIGKETVGRKGSHQFDNVSGKAVCRKEKYTKRISYEDMTWSLVGKVDARDKDTIIEVKNRKERFMQPEYDIIQLQAYMFISGKQKGILLERFRGENKKTNFDFNESDWNNVIIPDMYKFVKDVENKILTNHNLLYGFTPPNTPKKRSVNLPTESPSKFPRMK
ncbi:uncharacterized protein LOC124452109 [Xenia sp. Carnegie-2017]|uniref:uncharacterized protein LOC124452109 n=1 Tax=Xenia sp. Carnegie-2017 TaxID=2897299 RepID=UPI001F045CCE|nr:uncharacterized protein LOC124452109 [Xenia sp. Carnegie-2017]